MRHIQSSFVQSGMIDEETKIVPVFDKLIGTCQRWISLNKDIGVSRLEKEYCRNQFQTLMKIQLANGQITYPNIKSVGIPYGT